MPYFINHGFGGDNRNWSRPLFLCWKAGLINVLERENLELFGFFLKYSVYHIRKMLTNNCSQKVGTGGPGFISGQITWMMIVLRRKSGSCSLFLFAGFLAWNGNVFLSGFFSFVTIHQHLWVLLPCRINSKEQQLASIFWCSVRCLLKLKRRLTLI